MVPAFLVKAMKCVNAAPVRGVSISSSDDVWKYSCSFAEKIQRYFLKLLIFQLALHLVNFFFICLFVFKLFFRNGEGHFKHRGKQPEREETKDSVGQKYRLRERYLRHHREKGHFNTRPITTGIHSGIFKGKYFSSFFSDKIIKES